MFCKIGSFRGSRLPSEIAILQSTKYTRPGQVSRESSGTMEGGGSEDCVLWEDTEGFTKFNSTEKSSDLIAQQLEEEERDGGVSRRKRAKYSFHEAQKEEIENITNLIKDICCAPLYDAIRTDQWLSSPYKYTNDQDTNVKKAINNVTLNFAHMNLKEFMEFYKERIDKGITPQWSAPSLKNFHEYYFDLDTSKYKALQLLIHQCADLDKDYDIPEDNNWKPPVFTFLKELILLIDKRLGKTNTFYFISPTCSGKTFFFEMIKDFLLLHGNMSNWNKYNQFPLQMCIDKKILFWNEPDAAESFYEDLKKVTGGEYYSANIKNRMHMELKKTPLIITGNNRSIFPMKPEWLCRINYYTWKTAPFLKDNGSKKLHPLTFYYLIKATENFYQEDLLDCTKEITV